MPAIGAIVRAGPDSAPFAVGDRVFLVVDRDEDITPIHFGGSRYLLVRAANLLAKVDYAGMCSLVTRYVNGAR